MSTSPTTVTKPAADLITFTVDGKVVSVPRTTPDPLTGRPVPTTMIQAWLGSRGGMASTQLR